MTTPPSFSRSDRAAVLLALIGMAVAAPFAWASSNMEFVLYAVSLVVIGIGVAFLHTRVRLHPLAVWGLVLWGALHMAGGLVPVGDGVLYGVWLVPDRLRYDQVVHAYGFGLSTAICWQALRGRLDVPRASFGIALLCALGGMGLGALNEVLEFVAVLTLPETNVGGYVNTGWDLVFNAGGALLVGAVLWLRDLRRGAPGSGPDR